MYNRKKHTFPTRQYPYKKGSTAEDKKFQIQDFVSDAIEDEETKPKRMEEFPIMKFILGEDRSPEPMHKEDLDKLDDAFANLLLKKNKFPLTLNQILKFLDKHNKKPDGLPGQNSFLVADGGQILWTEDTEDLNRQFRFVISRSNAAGEVALLISASTLPDSKSQFLQLISWDQSQKAYNFYERRGKSWFWAGNSYHALKKPTRGKGPFDSHVNGALVMKELKLPWVHWHSMTASINDDVLAPDDELRNEKLWMDKLGGQEFEIKVARPGVIKWNKARFEKNITSDGILENCHQFFRQVVQTTSVNIITSEQESKSISASSLVRIPESFFFNIDALMNEVHLEPAIEPIFFEGKHYLSGLENFDFHIGDDNFKFKGDTHFAFLVPEPSFEDINIISLLISKGIVSKKFIASLLMVDFTNPVYSKKRHNLLRYFPKKGAIANFSIESEFLSNIRNSEESRDSSTAEGIFLSLFTTSDDSWQKTFETKIENYFKKLKNLVTTKEGFYELLKLSESRRREFRKTDLAEFRLTTPITNIPDNAPLLEITENAEIITKQ